MWYKYPRDVEGISENMIALPTRNNSNPHQDKYSRTSVEEIRRIVLTYMEKDDFFLENCCGWSTFGAIAKMHGYSGVGVDIWETAIEYSKKQIELIKNDANVEIIEADGMALPFEDNKFDYIYCNPPFMDVEIYSGKDNDITGKNHKEFINNFERLMSENYRCLKKGKLCTITIADTRKNKILKSLLNIVLNASFAAKFSLHDIVIVEVLGVANMYRKKAYENKRMPKNHEYVITFVK
jgi:SAM-dependent methyltransferase